MVSSSVTYILVLVSGLIVLIVGLYLMSKKDMWGWFATDVLKPELNIPVLQERFNELQQNSKTAHYDQGPYIIRLRISSEIRARGMRMGIVYVKGDVLHLELVSEKKIEHSQLDLKSDFILCNGPKLKERLVYKTDEESYWYELMNPLKDAAILKNDYMWHPGETYKNDEDLMSLKQYLVKNGAKQIEQDLPHSDRKIFES